MPNNISEFSKDDFESTIKEKINILDEIIDDACEKNGEEIYKTLIKK